MISGLLVVEGAMLLELVAFREEAGDLPVPVEYGL
jgi:hypothetical protein